MINLIYDGDIGPDPCDFSTLSVLHEYHVRKMINLVGVMGVTPDPYLASTFSIYNQIYGHDIPIGAWHDNSKNIRIAAPIRERYYKALAWACKEPNPNRVIYEKFGNADTATAAGLPDSVEAYRKLLSHAEDSSITIYAAGQLYNFEALLQTTADQYSDASGQELLARKVDRFVFMGGYFPNSLVNQWYQENTDGAEWNWWGFGSRETTATVLATITAMGKPVTYIGAEQGVRVLIGREMASRLGRNHPTTEAFVLSSFLTTGEGDTLQWERENPAYDEITLFHAVEDGVGQYFDQVPGRVSVDASGANGWVEEQGTNERYLTIRAGVEAELAGLMTDRITGQF